MTALLSRVFLLAWLLASPAALAQTYPDCNVTIVVTSAAGALTDVLTRAVAQGLTEMWKQSVFQAYFAATLSGFAVCGENLASVSQVVAGKRHGRSIEVDFRTA